MQVDDYLKLLQSQYPGRVVLYADDIAKILGKTKRSLDGLIARDGLPFRIKKLNGRWCTGILDVANWLSSDNQTETHPAPTAASTRKGKTSPTPPSSNPRGRVSFAAELRKMRMARTFQTFCNKLSALASDDEREFVAEMLQSALPAEILMLDRYVETDLWFRVEECDLEGRRLVVRRVTHHGGHYSSINFKTLKIDSAAVLITFNLGRRVTGHAYRVGRMDWVFSGDLSQTQG
jgi:hypothetical protein